MTFPNSFQAGGIGGLIKIDNVTSAYTVVPADLVAIINCTSGTFTVALTAAATLGSGFYCYIQNTSTSDSDVITIDPNGVETIDGGSTSITIRSGQGLGIYCNGTSFFTLNSRISRNAVAVGRDPGGANAVASAQGALALTNTSTASALYALAFGKGTTASVSYGCAIAANSGGSGSQAVTGAGAMALGGSYASGTDSFAAAIANNTSTYGALGANSIAMGYQCAATASKSTVVGGENGTASGATSVALGGSVNVASGESSYAFGVRAVANEVGKYAYGATTNHQGGMLILRRATTDATPSVMVSNTNAAGTANQLTLANNQAMAVTGLVLGRRSVADADTATGWTFTAVIRRGANAAATALVAAVTPVAIASDAGLATASVAVTADTTNGSLAVTVTGIAATSIKWTCTLHTSEVIYA